MNVRLDSYVINKKGNFVNLVLLSKVTGKWTTMLHIVLVKVALNKGFYPEYYVIKRFHQNLIKG